MRKSVLAGGGAVAVMLAIALLVQRCTGNEAGRDVTPAVSRAAATPRAGRLKRQS